MLNSIVLFKTLSIVNQNLDNAIIAIIQNVDFYTAHLAFMNAKMYQADINYFTQLINKNLNNPKRNKEEDDEILYFYYEHRGDAKVAKEDFNGALNDYISTSKLPDSFTSKGDLYAKISLIYLDNLNSLDKAHYYAKQSLEVEPDNTTALKIIKNQHTQYFDISNSKQKNYKILIEKEICSGNSDGIEYARQLYKTSTNHFIVIGNYQKYTAKWLCMLDENFNCLWFKKNDNIVFYDILPKLDYFIALSMKDDFVYLQKYDYSGNLLCETKLVKGYGSRIIESKDGYYYILSTFDNGEVKQSDVVLLKVDTNGNILFKKEYGGNESTMAGGLCFKDNGNIIFALSLSKLFIYEVDCKFGNTVQTKEIERTHEYDFLQNIVNIGHNEFILSSQNSTLDSLSSPNRINFIHFRFDTLFFGKRNIFTTNKSIFINEIMQPINNQLMFKFNDNIGFIDYGCILQKYLSCTPYILEYCIALNSKSYVLLCGKKIEGKYVPIIKKILIE